MNRYLARGLGSRLAASRTLYLLSVLGVALGVASVVSIQIISLNALSAFRGSVRAVGSGADFSVLPRSDVLDEALYPRVLAQEGVAAAWPLYRLDVAVTGADGLFLEILGVDPVSPQRIPWAGSKDEREPVEDLAAALLTRGWVALGPALARERGWGVGDTLVVSSGSRSAVLTVGALVDFRRVSPMASRKLAVMDIAQAQGLFGRRGELHEIGVRIAAGFDADAVRENLAAALGGAARIRSGSERVEDAQGLLGAFRINLTALSLVSVFVGVFLIYTSCTASLVRRRTEFGLLRSLGADRTQILGIILGEVCLLGLAGTLVGIPLGYLAASMNVGVVSTTLTQVYLLEEIERLRIPLSVYLLGAGVGVGGALLGGLLPAWDMSRRDIRSLLVGHTLHEQVGGLSGRLFLAGLLLSAVALGWFLLWGRGVRPGGFVLALAMLFVLPLVTPQLVRWLGGRLPAAGFGFRYSVRTLTLKLQTTAVSVAALAVAVSMLVGVTLLVESFRRTLETWVETSIRADVYVTTRSWERAGREATLTPDLVAALAGFPGVEEIEKLRRFEVTAAGRRIVFAGLERVVDESNVRIPLRHGESREVWRRLQHEGAVLVSEPLARKAGLGIGDTLRIAGPSGDVGLPVAGVSYDYSSENGAAMVSLGTLESIFGEGPINNVALWLEEGADAGATVDAVKAAFADRPLVIRSNRELRNEVFRVFDQTFAVTRLLEGIALVVALAGISLTLLVLARERVAELALYRALGAMRRQIFRVFLGEGLGIGLLGCILGLAGGVVLAVILVFIINPTYFGWTIRARWAWGELGEEMAVILVAAVLAGVYPALRASRVPARELSRDDL